VNIDKENHFFEFKDLCRKSDLKITPQRVVIYEILSSTDEHPSAETVYKKARRIMPNISFDTVNRTLNTFSDIGAAFIVEGTGDVRRFDAGLGVHQHFKCVKCKRIIDFHYKEFDNVHRPAELEKFDILKSTVYFEGICDVCKKK
jgi:Fur family peroxide stress response transcriptional regulator